MAQQHRYGQPRWRAGERGPNVSREWNRDWNEDERDRYRAGEERRYTPDWDEDNRGSRGRAFEGERSYPAGGYAEEVGYRRAGRHDYNDPQPSYPYQGSGPNWSGDRGGRRESQYDRGPQYGTERNIYRDFEAHWDNQDENESYFGTGHQGGAFGSAAGTRASSAGSFYGPTSGGVDFYGRRSYGAGWPSSGGRGEEWRNSGPGEPYGSQSSYGRNAQYGGNEGNEYGGYAQQRYASQGYGSQDYGSQQSFRGRGPKGYQRSDDRLKEIICEHLMEDPDIDASEVNVEVSGSVVTLTGTIDDRRAKYQIEDVIERIGGVRDINNQLRVEAGGNRQQAGSQWNTASSGSSRERSGTGSSTTAGSTSLSGSSSGASTKKN